MFLGVALNYPMHPRFTKFKDPSTSLICLWFTQRAIPVTGTRSTSICTFTLFSSSFLWLRLCPRAPHSRALHPGPLIFIFSDESKFSVPSRPFSFAISADLISHNRRAQLCYIISPLCTFALPCSYSRHQPMCTSLMEWTHPFLTNSQRLIACLEHFSILCSIVLQQVWIPSINQTLGAFRWPGLSTNVPYHCHSLRRSLDKRFFSFVIHPLIDVHSA